MALLLGRVRAPSKDAINAFTVFQNLATNPKTKEKVALMADNTSITYTQLYAMVDSLCSWLKEGRAKILSEEAQNRAKNYVIIEEETENEAKKEESQEEETQNEENGNVKGETKIPSDEENMEVTQNEETKKSNQNEKNLEATEVEEGDENGKKKNKKIAKDGEDKKDCDINAKIETSLETSQVTTIALCLPRSPTLVALILAIWKLGWAYVPLDPSVPGLRSLHVLRDAEPALIIATSETGIKIRNLESDAALSPTAHEDSRQKSTPQSEMFPLAGRILDIDGWKYEANENCEKVKGNEKQNENDAREIEKEEEKKIKMAADEVTKFDHFTTQKLDNEKTVACILYTSGSTGNPKGVPLTMGNLMNRFCWQWEQLPFEDGEVCLMSKSLSFVDSLTEAMVPLLGGTPVAVVQEDVVNPEILIRYVCRYGVTRLVLVPSLLKLLLLYLNTTKEAIRLLHQHIKIWVTSGETLPSWLVNDFYAMFPGRRFLNLYGSTEVTGDVTWGQVEESNWKAGVRVPVGRALDNTAVLIVRWEDGRLKLAENGQIGEVAVIGRNVSPGYIKGKVLSKEILSKDVKSASFVHISSISMKDDKKKLLHDFLKRVYQENFQSGSSGYVENEKSKSDRPTSAKNNSIPTSDTNKTSISTSTSAKTILTSTSISTSATKTSISTSDTNIVDQTSSTKSTSASIPTSATKTSISTSDTNIFNQTSPTNSTSASIPTSATNSTSTSATISTSTSSTNSTSNSATIISSSNSTTYKTSASITSTPSAPQTSPILAGNKVKPVTSPRIRGGPPPPVPPRTPPKVPRRFLAGKPSQDSSAEKSGGQTENGENLQNYTRTQQQIQKIEQKIEQQKIDEQQNREQCMNEMRKEFRQNEHKNGTVTETKQNKNRSEENEIEQQVIINKNKEKTETEIENESKVEKQLKGDKWNENLGDIGDQESNNEERQKTKGDKTQGDKSQSQRVGGEQQEGDYLREKNGRKNSSEEEEGRSEIADPKIDIADSSKKIADPSKKIADPGHEIADTNQEIANQSQEIANPKIEITDPKIEIAKNSIDQNERTEELGDQISDQQTKIENGNEKEISQNENRKREETNHAPKKSAAEKVEKYEETELGEKSDQKSQTSQDISTDGTILTQINKQHPEKDEKNTKEGDEEDRKKTHVKEGITTENKDMAGHENRDTFGYPCDQDIEAFLNDLGVMLYLTGDLGRIGRRNRGDLVLEGRTDSQVKVRGVRVHLNELEDAVQRSGYVNEQCVLATGEGDGDDTEDEDDKVLVAFVSLRSEFHDRDTSVSEDLTRCLRAYLPQAIVPRVVVLGSIPHLPSGKVDRMSLLRLHQRRVAHQRDSRDGVLILRKEEPIETRVLRIICGALGVARSHDVLQRNFFQLGGTSITSVSVVVRLRELGLDLTLESFLKATTIGDVVNDILKAKTMAEVMTLFCCPSPAPSPSTLSPSTAGRSTGRRASFVEESPIIVRGGGYAEDLEEEVELDEDITVSSDLGIPALHPDLPVCRGVTKGQRGKGIRLAQLHTLPISQGVDKVTVIEMVAESFIKRNPLDVAAGVTAEAHYTLLSSLWPRLVHDDLSFVVKDPQRGILGVVINTDFFNEPQVEIPESMAVVSAIHQPLEEQVRQLLRQEASEIVGGIRRESLTTRRESCVNRRSSSAGWMDTSPHRRDSNSRRDSTLSGRDSRRDSREPAVLPTRWVHNLFLATNVSLSPQDNVRLALHLEKEVIRVSQSRHYHGVVTLNSNPINQVLCENYLGYERRGAVRVNTFLHQGKRPFFKLPQDLLLVAMTKDL